MDSCVTCERKMKIAFEIRRSAVAFHEGQGKTGIVFPVDRCAEKEPFIIGNAKEAVALEQFPVIFPWVEYRLVNTGEVALDADIVKDRARRNLDVEFFGLMGRVAGNRRKNGERVRPG